MRLQTSPCEIFPTHGLENWKYICVCYLWHCFSFKLIVTQDI